MPILFKKNTTLSILIIVIFSIFVFFCVKNVSHAQVPSCQILSAAFSPNGTMPDGWYTNGTGNRAVSLSIHSQNCNGSSMSINLIAKNGGTEKIWNHTIGSDDELFTINAKAGESACSIFSSPDCQYRLEIRPSSGSNYNSDGTTHGNLNYDCDGTCFDAWQTISTPPPLPNPEVTNVQTDHDITFNGKNFVIDDPSGYFAFTLTQADDATNTTTLHNNVTTSTGEFKLLIAGPPTLISGKSYSYRVTNQDGSKLYKSGSVTFTGSGQSSGTTNTSTNTTSTGVTISGIGFTTYSNKNVDVYITNTDTTTTLPVLSVPVTTSGSFTVTKNSLSSGNYSYKVTPSNSTSPIKTSTFKIDSGNNSSGTQSVTTTHTSSSITFTGTGFTNQKNTNVKIILTKDIDKTAVPEMSVPVNASGGFTITKDGLEPALTYTYKVTASNSTNSLFDGEVTLDLETTPPPPLSTGGKISINTSEITTTADSVTITGTVSDSYLALLKDDPASGIKFIYGTDENELTQSSQPLHSLNNGGPIDFSGNFSVTLSNLTNGKYYYNVVRSDPPGDGMLLSATQTFQIGNVATVTFETVTTTKDSATIQFSVDTKGDPVDLQLTYGTADSNTLGHPNIVWSGPTNGPSSVPPALISGLQPATAYKFSIANAKTGEVYVVEEKFTTKYINGNTITLDSKNNPANDTVSCTEGKGEYCLIAPLPGFDGGKINTETTGLGSYINTIINIVMGLMAAAAVVMIVLGGIQWMSTDSVGGKSEGKDRIQNAIWGLILLLGAYAILNTISPTLVNLTINSKTVSYEAIKIDPNLIESDKPQAPIDGKVCKNQNNGQGWEVGPSNPWFTDDAGKRNELAQLKISVNRKACVYVGETNCTSVAQLNTSVVEAGITKLENAGCKDAKCEYKITGGTECWAHSANTAHGPGHTAIDLGSTGTNSAPNLVKFVTDQKYLKGKIEGWGILYVVNGIEFVDEGDHFHVWGWNGDHANLYPKK